MRVHSSAHARNFTVLPNAALRDPSLSFTARGILCHLLSLPDGAREDVRTLADRYPRIGRRGVAKAMDELIDRGYYVRRTTHDPATGQVRTETHVYDTPQRPGSPLPTNPGTGAAETGNPGASPEGEEDQGKETSLPARELSADPDPAPVQPSERTASDLARAAALLARVTGREPKLALSAAETLALAPLAVPWLDRGVSDLVARSLLTSGLPPVVFSARAVLADRLRRKLPAPRTHHDAAAPAPPLAECAECRDPLPPTQTAGICTPCTGATPRPAPTPPLPASVQARVSALRATLRDRSHASW
ncbi:helix-turn-helix domain-containing protein [Streptomyces sp. NBC_01465]|uniref:helix-turn-helix domain-containing protein n=1 Tax=Streptomyces sp. NBC_01465 TaxID=2903878 RepID=UPI002E2FE263|nr:helix-turn-helix domain-containing protein [Streptomyces sp. NBC_01465]